MGPSGFNSEDLFHSALELPSADRLEFLKSSCGSNHELFAEIKKLLDIADSRPDLLLPPDVGMIPELLGRYQLITECGRGGMGIVFEARDTKLLRKVALKLLPQFLSRDKKSLQRFTREAQTLARLNHPNIATLHSLEESGDFHFLTMEFISGVTLADVLVERVLSLSETLSLGLQVSLALEAAHALDICHCDLKPANIMVSPDGKITLLDFGIARAFEHLLGPSLLGPTVLSDSSFLSGTPNYMAPEQAAGQTVNERTDMWAMGVVLLECLTGHCSVSDTGQDDSKYEKLSPNTPHRLVELLTSCLCRDPDKRLGSATAAREIFEELLCPQTNKHLIIGVVGSLILTVALVMFWAWGSEPSGPLDRIDRTSKTSIEGKNQKGELLWQREFEGPIRAAVVIKKEDPSASSIEKKKTVGCVVTNTKKNGANTLDFLDLEDGHVLWNHDPAWSVPVNVTGPVRYKWTIAAPWPGRDEPIILNGIRDARWYSFAVEALDMSGNILGVYHHPGPLSIIPYAPGSGQDGSGLLLFGANSSARFVRKLVPFETVQHPGCVLLLMPPEITGQAFPYSENLPEHRDWPGLPKAREHAYLVIPPIRADCDAVVESVETKDPVSGHIGYTAQVRDGRLIILDQDLFPIKCIVSRNTIAEDVYRAGEASDAPFLYILEGVQEWVAVSVEF